MLEDLEVLEDPGCTAEEGSPGVDRSLAEVGRNLEARHIVEVADRTAAAAGEEDRPGRRCSSHLRGHGHQEQRRQVPRESHRRKAANLRCLYAS